jgi:hypothetical protein
MVSIPLPPSAALHRLLGRVLRLSMLFVFVIGGAVAPALAQNISKTVSGPAVHGQHCLGEERQKLLLDHYLAGSINPLGIGQVLRLSLCTPLITKPGLMFDLTNIEVGALLLNSPTYVSFGGFVNLVPLSILVLRAEADGFYIWPTPLEGAGFITLPTSRDFTKVSLSPSPFGPNPATTASGGRILLGATLRGELPIGKWLSIAVTDSINGEYWRVSDGTWAQAAALGHSVFYVARRDVVLNGPGDWLLMNTAALLLGINAHPNVTVRVGATDDLVFVPSQKENSTYSCSGNEPDPATIQYQPSSGYIGNVAAGVVAVTIKNLRGLARDFSFFMRVGGFTNHAFRECSGATFALGADVTYELMSRPYHRPPPAAEAAPPPAPAAPPAPPAPPAEAAPAPAEPGTEPAPSPLNPQAAAPAGSAATTPATI